MKRVISLAVAAVVMGTTPAFGAVSDSEFAQLKADFQAMAARLNALESENSVLREISKSTMTELEVAKSDISNVKSSAAASSWTDTVAIDGDFRYRYETIDIEGADRRERNRVRARAELTATLPNSVDVGIGVASGGDDPVSSNQTLGGGGSSKELKLDLAYAKWNATEDIYLMGGKYKNPLFAPQKSGLLWDGDWRPEGISTGWASENLFATFLGTWLESDSRGGNDTFAWGLQGGTNVNIGSAILTASLGYYDFPTAGRNSFYDDKFFGNASVDGKYVYDYQMIEVGADLGLSLLDMPFNVFAHYVQNQDADDYDTGWQAGAKIGKAKAGRWELTYRYQDLEADAVLGLLSDSDFAGGGTDGKGHVVQGAYGISNQWKLGFTWFVDNEAGEKNLADKGGALTYDRIMLDTEFKF